MHPTSGRPPRQIQNAVQQHNLLIVPTLQRGSAILTLQRHQTGSTPRREAFFSLPAQRKEPVVWSAPHHCERAALPLRRPRSTGCGTGGARTRCAQTACPLFLVPHPAARLSAKGLFRIVPTHIAVWPTPTLHPRLAGSVVGAGHAREMHPTSGRLPRSKKPLNSTTLIVPTLQRGNAILTLQRHPDGLVPSPGGVLFFACPKKRTKRKGSPAAETTPVDGPRNRRGKNSLRSNSLPLFPGSAPRRPAQRQRAVCFPGDPSCREPSSWRGQRSSSRLGGTITCLSAPSHPSPAGWPVAVGAGHARDGVASVTFSDRSGGVSALTFRVPPFRVARERNP